MPETFEVAYQRLWVDYMVGDGTYTLVWPGKPWMWFGEKHLGSAR